MLILADARHLPIADGCVQCVVTSPPYWGLRDYGTPDQIGLERTPDEYVQTMVAVFREVRRVLTADGIAFLNLGDSYATGAGKVGDCPGGGAQGESWKERGAMTSPNRMPLPGLKPKDLVGIPWRVAFALQADGWYLRSDIIWHKPNPMPESVTDRPTKAHEYLFLLAKAERYYYDADAIREANTLGTIHRLLSGPVQAKREGPKNAIGRRDAGAEPYSEANGRNRRSVWTIPTRPYPGAHFATMPEALVEPCILAGSRGPGKRCDCDEVIGTPLGSGPIDDPSIVTGRAGMNRPRRTDEGTRPITRREQRSHADQMRLSPWRDEMAAAAGPAFAHYIRTDRSGARPLPPDLLTAWLAKGWLKEPEPCRCPEQPGDLVLDPFCGTGTVGRVALRHGRRFVGTDLNPTYLRDLAPARLSNIQTVLPLDGEVA